MTINIGGSHTIQCSEMSLYIAELKLQMLLPVKGSTYVWYDAMKKAAEEVKMCQ